MVSILVQIAVHYNEYLCVKDILLILSFSKCTPQRRKRLRREPAHPAYIRRSSPDTAPATGTSASASAC